MKGTKVLIRGGGDLASAVALRLVNSGFRVMIAELEKPLCVRRTVSFSEAIFSEIVVVEGITGVRIDLREIPEWLKQSDPEQIGVVSDPGLRSLKMIRPEIFVDGTLEKRNDGITRDLAPITIALGPGFEAGVDVDAVIETQRGHHLGRIYYQGMAIPDTGVPGIIEDYGIERVIYARVDGVLSGRKSIGDPVEKGESIAEIVTAEGEIAEVPAAISGLLRGLIPNGTVRRGLKIGDIDPRKDQEFIHTVSDKGRTVSGGVLEAILYLKNNRQERKEMKR